MRSTPERMRSLADAVPGPSGGVRFQPIFPATLREWAEEMEDMQQIINQCRMALSGYVSRQSAIDMINSRVVRKTADTKEPSE